LKTVNAEKRELSRAELNKQLSHGLERQAALEAICQTWCGSPLGFR
jgi:hypothetical protein